LRLFCTTKLLRKPVLSDPADLVSTLLLEEGIDMIIATASSRNVKGEGFPDSGSWPAKGHYGHDGQICIPETRRRRRRRKRRRTTRRTGPYLANSPALTLSDPSNMHVLTTTTRRNVQLGLTEAYMLGEPSEASWQ
jgi:hypothetical protein